MFLNNSFAATSKQMETSFPLLKPDFFIAFIISIYTLIDGLGVRSVGKSETYIVWNFFLGGWVSIAYVYLTKKKALFELQSKELFLILIASIIFSPGNSFIIFVP